jgi:hypothetical protein
LPEISRFFGIIIRMFYADHDPPHLHAEHESGKVLLDFRLIREWIDVHGAELAEDWELARASKELKKIAPPE